MTVNRDTARRYTTRARAAAIALLVAAGAVIALPLPMLRPAASAGATGIESAGAVTPEPAPYEPPLDSIAATTTLWNVGLPPAAPVVEPEKSAGSGTATAGAAPAATPAAKAGWRYVGSIIGPRGTHALLEHDGRQKLAKAGEKVDGATVVSIGDNHVMLDDGSGPKKIEIAPLASRWSPENVSRPQIAASTPAVAPSRPGPQARPGVQPQRPGINPMGNPAANMINQANMVNQVREYSSDGMTDEEREKFEVYEKMRQRSEEEGAAPQKEGAQR